jgi:hypothetical protein
MARRGRPPKGEYPEKKRVFASRIREDTWEMLQRAAAKSGRSLSQEFEFRLRRSLDDDEKIGRPGCQIDVRPEEFESSLDRERPGVRRGA